jgi:negative regulator of flagellin synthesis FlgM
MKIESSSQPTGVSLLKDTRVQTSKKASSASENDVQLSVASSLLSTTDDEPSFDAARVSEIKQAIADGRFTINAGAIADSLISSARELIASQQQA